MFFEFIMLLRLMDVSLYCAQSHVISELCILFFSCYATSISICFVPQTNLKAQNTVGLFTNFSELPA